MNLDKRLDKVQQYLIAHDLGTRLAVVREVIPVWRRIIGCGTVGVIAVHACGGAVVQRDDAAGRRARGPSHREIGYLVVELHSLARSRSESIQPLCGRGYINGCVDNIGARCIVIGIF